MLAILKVLGKWGANVAVIISIPIASAKHDMQEHKGDVAVERAAFNSRLTNIESTVNDMRDTQLEDRKILHKILEIELRRLEAEKQK